MNSFSPGYHDLVCNFCNSKTKQVVTPEYSFGRAKVRDLVEIHCTNERCGNTYLPAIEDHRVDRAVYRQMVSDLEEAIEVIRFYVEPFTWSRVKADSEHGLHSGGLNNMYGQKARDFIAKVSEK